MAVAVLAPWPTSPAELTAARDCLKGALGIEDDDLAQRLGSTAGELVERYAPAAPQAVRNEAVIRCAGWLLDAPADGTRGHTAGPFSVENSPSMLSALRSSGAMGLLTAWKVRRAGVIG